MHGLFFPILSRTCGLEATVGISTLIVQWRRSWRPLQAHIRSKSDSVWMTSVRAFREVTSTINQDPHYTDHSAVAVICGQLVTLKWKGICNLQCADTFPLPPPSCWQVLFSLQHVFQWLGLRRQSCFRTTLSTWWVLWFIYIVSDLYILKTFLPSSTRRRRVYIPCHPNRRRPYSFTPTSYHDPS